MPCLDGQEHLVSADPRYSGSCARCGKIITPPTLRPEHGAALYLAGPMTGIPAFNIPAFDAAATRLRDLGYEVFSPAELDNPETRAVAIASPDGAPGSGSANGESWADFLARDVKLIGGGSVEGVVVLPGWSRSRGARLETFVARICKLPVWDYNDAGGQPLTPTSREDLDAAHTR
jgi:hypothetical protein